MKRFGLVAAVLPVLCSGPWGCGGQGSESMARPQWVEAGNLADSDGFVGRGCFSHPTEVVARRAVASMARSDLLSKLRQSLESVLDQYVARVSEPSNKDVQDAMGELVPTVVAQLEDQVSITDTWRDSEAQSPMVWAVAWLDRSTFDQAVRAGVKEVNQKIPLKDGADPEAALDEILSAR